MPKKTASEKMYLKPDMIIGFFNPPENVEHLLGGIPEDSTRKEPSGDQNLDWLLGFIENQKMLENKLEFLKQSITQDGALWLAYHKGSSSVDTDINRDTIHDLASSFGLKGVAMVSINDDWSGFRFKKI